MRSWFRSLVFAGLAGFPLAAGAIEKPNNRACTSGSPPTPYSCCTGAGVGTCHVPIQVTAATHTGANTAGLLYPCTSAGKPYECCVAAGPGTECASVLNGADLCVALEQCEQQGGCRIQLPAGVIAQAEHRIYGTRYWSINENTPCGGNFGDQGGFPNGLVVQGKGIGNTILEATYSGNSYMGARGLFGVGDHQSVVNVALQNGLDAAEAPYVVYQDLTIDGRSDMQPTSVVTQYAFYAMGNLGGPGMPRPYTEQPYRNLIVRRVEMKRSTSLLSRFGVPNLYPDQQWLDTRGIGLLQILQNKLVGGGCHQAHTFDGGFPGVPPGSPGAAPCGCNRADAGATCAGWNSLPDITPVAPGWKSQGANLDVFRPSNTLLAANHFDIGLHFNIASGTSVPNPGTTVNFASERDEFGPGATGTGWIVVGNRFSRTGGGDVDNHGAYTTVHARNVHDGTCLDDNIGIFECGTYTFATQWQRWIYFHDNHYLGQRSARGFELNFWRPLPGEAPFGAKQQWPEMLMENEKVELDCRRCPVSASLCQPYSIEAGQSIHTFHGDTTSSYSYDNYGIRIKNFEFVDTDGINSCGWGSFIAEYGRRRPSTHPQVNQLGWVRDLTIEGGTFISGGVPAVSDGCGIPWDSAGGAADTGCPEDAGTADTSANTADRMIAYFNNTPNLKLIGNITFDGRGVNPSKVTFGRNTGTTLDNITGCYNTPSITLTPNTVLQNRASLATTCP